jgi:riboflavin kinase/FMN adenylyltransferase
MTELENELGASTPNRDTYISIGVFDGVHLGHRHLVKLLQKEANQAGCASAVITFYNHPKTILTPEATTNSLTDSDDKLLLLRSLGVDIVIPVTFTAEVAALKAQEFVGVLQRCLRMRGLVIGPDFALGNKRSGTPDVLRNLGNEMGFVVTVANLYKRDNLHFSSSGIRSALADGNVTMATRLLGRYYNLTGKVVHGANKGGSVLGYPTANIIPNSATVLPKDGIYATWAYVEQRWYLAATNIGTRPTFNTGPRTIEAFILDFKGDIYDKKIRLEFVQRLRGEVAFENIEALKKQMQKDVIQTRLILNT